MSNEDETVMVNEDVSNEEDILGKINEAMMIENMSKIVLIVNVEDLRIDINLKNKRR